MRTVSRIVESLPVVPMEPLPAPPYAPRVGGRVGLAVESMKRHTTDEGWQLFAGLESAGYTLHGFDIGPSLTDVREVLRREQPSTMVVQDQREWEGLTADRSRDPRMRFTGLCPTPGVFTLTVLKDAQHDPQYHANSAASMGAHAWVVYYDPRIVTRLAPYTRAEHLVRTYHTLDADRVPAFSAERHGVLLSGALGRAYPLRTALSRCSHPLLTVLKHPGYHRRGTHTPDYLRTLSRFRVAVCTSSVFGYALRKLVEATACGCVVVTDLPVDEVMPGIDANLYRVSSNEGVASVMKLCQQLHDAYDHDLQRGFAQLAAAYYDYRVEGARLTANIEALRRSYAASS